MKKRAKASVTRWYYMIPSIETFAESNTFSRWKVGNVTGKGQATKQIADDLIRWRNVVIAPSGWSVSARPKKGSLHRFVPFCES